MIQLYSLAVFLTGNVREAAPLSEQKTRPGNHQRAGGETTSLPPQVVFEAILTREKMGSTVSAMVLPFRMANWKKILCARWRFRSARNAYSFRCHRQPTVDLLFALLVPADQTKTHLHICRWWRNVWRTKPSAAVYAQPER